MKHKAEMLYGLYYGKHNIEIQFYHKIVDEIIAPPLTVNGWVLPGRIIPAACSGQTDIGQCDVFISINHHDY